MRLKSLPSLIMLWQKQKHCAELGMSIVKEFWDWELDRH